MNTKQFSIGQRVLVSKLNGKPCYEHEGEIVKLPNSIGLWGVRVKPEDWGTDHIYRMEDQIQAVREEAAV